MFFKGLLRKQTLFWLLWTKAVSCCWNHYHWSFQTASWIIISCIASWALRNVHTVMGRIPGAYLAVQKHMLQESLLIVGNYDHPDGFFAVSVGFRAIHKKNKYFGQKLVSGLYTRAMFWPESSKNFTCPAKLIKWSFETRSEFLERFTNAFTITRK